MKTLRLMTMTALASGLLLTGCGDDGRSGTDGGTEEDSGVDLMDGGGGGDDSGTGGGDDSGTGGGDDSGTGGGDDSGTGTSMCPAGACNIVTGDGCDVGQACQYGSEGPTCVEAGTAGDDESCSGPTDCQEGFACIGPPGGATTCQPYCCGSNDDCPTGQMCLVNVQNESGETLFQVCDLPDDCDLVAQTGCEGDEGCYPISDDGSVSCAPAGDLMQGESCGSQNDCAKGFACIDDPGMCAKLCNPMAADPGCPAETSCGGLGGFPEDVGVCVSGSG